MPDPKTSEVNELWFRYWSVTQHVTSYTRTFYIKCPLEWKRNNHNVTELICNKCSYYQLEVSTQPVSRSKHRFTSVLQLYEVLSEKTMLLKIQLQNLHQWFLGLEIQRQRRSKPAAETGSGTHVSCTEFASWIWGNVKLKHFHLSTLTSECLSFEPAPDCCTVLTMK